MKLLTTEQMVLNAKHNKKVYSKGGRNCLCQWCGADFESRNRTIQRYCSNSCRVMAHIDRKRNWDEYTEKQLNELRD